MTSSFNSHQRRYEAWFSRHKAAYFSELFEVLALLPWKEIGLEIGVGTGRFVAPSGPYFLIKSRYFTKTEFEIFLNLSVWKN
jgi:hypothetical protein